MIESFKKFRKRHVSNDPIIALFALGACGKTTRVEELAHHSVLKIKGDGETKIVKEDTLPQISGLAASNSEDKFVLIRYQPTIVDHPIHCPQPAQCVIQDGQIWKEQVPSVKRKGPLPFLTESQLQELLWKRRTAPSDSHIFPAASAPESELVNFLP